MTTNRLIILGANGFIGKSLIAQSMNRFLIKAVSRHIPEYANSISTIEWHSVDLLKKDALNPILEQNDIVINVAHIQPADSIDNIIMINNIIKSCLQFKVKRLVHCSTAVVVGHIKDVHIDEATPCNPYTQYEKIKFSMENILLGAVSKGLDIVILRPTAIVGAGGQNLLKMATYLHEGNVILNYLRACLFGRRKMNLVSVHNVASALLHLALYQNLENGRCYLISSDEDHHNNYLSIEKALSRSLGLKPRLIPVIQFPKFVLSTVLKLIKRNSSNSVRRIYDNKKLRSTHFFPQYALLDAIYEFGQNIRNNQNGLNKNV